MAGLLRRLPQSTSSLLKTLVSAPRSSRSILCNDRRFGAVSTVRSYLSASTPSAFDENLLRIIRSEIGYLSEYNPPHKPLPSFRAFTIQDNPGEQWVRLKSTSKSSEDIKIDATLFDGAANPNPNNPNPKLHISLIVEVSRDGSVFGFICSAWPDLLVVQKVIPLHQSGTAARPYMGPDFRDLDEEVKREVREFLEKRGVNDEMAEFLHDYMLNKDKIELIRWLKNIESYVEK